MSVSLLLHVIARLVAGLSAGLFIMQPDPDTRPGDAASPPSPVAPLGGPAVAPEANTRTLVKRDFNGTLERLEIPPEEAALELLNLSEQEKTDTRLILAERAAILDKVVGENLPLLIQANNARESGDAAAGTRYLRELSTHLRALTARGRLSDELVAVLSPENGQALRTLVRDYWMAVFEDARAAAQRAQASEMGGSAAGGDRASSREMMRRELLASLGAEIRRSYQRRIASRQGELDDLLSRLDLDDATEGEVRRLFADFAQQTLGNPTAAQRAQLANDLFRMLTPEQRRQVLEEVYGVRPAQPR
jgi:Spy/CpxP family protein refolding chaperone